MSDAGFAAGQVAVVAHVAAHELGAAACAIKAVRAAMPGQNGQRAGRLECCWQRDRFPDAIPNLVPDHHPTWSLIIKGCATRSAGGSSTADMREGEPRRRSARQVLVIQARSQPLPRRSLGQHVLPAFGNRAIGSIRRSDVQAYVDGLAAKLAPSTVVREYGFLHVFFQEAADMDPPIIVRNPCRKIVLPEDDDQEQRFFTPEDVRALYEAFDPRYKVMVLVGCFAGLRIGEPGGAPAPRSARRPRQNLRPPRCPRTPGRPSADRTAEDEAFPGSGRHSAVPHDMSALRDHVKEHPPAVDGPAKGLIFTSPDGEPLRPRNWRRRYWDPAVEVAGIDPATPHAMRHTFVSFLIDQGLSVERVPEQARHRDPGFTWRVYRHRFERRTSGVPETPLWRSKTCGSRGSPPAGRGDHGGTSGRCGRCPGQRPTVHLAPDQPRCVVGAAGLEPATPAL